MRPIPARLILGLLSAGGFAVAAMTGQILVLLFATLPLYLLATSVAGSRLPMTRQLSTFRGRSVRVLLWETAPPELMQATLAVTSVNVIGAGLHVFFRAADGRSFHLKVAQPRGASITPGEVTIESARYVQWNGKRMEGGGPALSIRLVERGATEAGSGTERPNDRAR